jgi:DNA-binding LacI/PurR family transcriptional regulator
MKVSKSKKSKNGEGQRKTIGLIINYLLHRYQRMICPGIMDGAAKHDCNLIAFVGKTLNSSLIYENQENVIYKFASHNNIDGLLILTGAVGNNLHIDKLKEFCYQYKPLPIVCVATPVQGLPSVWVDNRSGVRSIVSHFIKDHQYKRIVYIRGPVKNMEAELRYKIFKEVLRENNIPLHPELIYEGKFVWASGVEGVKTLLVF